MTSSIDTLNALEKAVLEKILYGESELYRILLRQICALRVTEKKMTGVGVFTRFSLPDEAPKLPDEASLEIGDVAANLNDLGHGAGFVLFIRRRMDQVQDNASPRRLFRPLYIGSIGAKKSRARVARSFAPLWVPNIG